MKHFFTLLLCSLLTHYAYTQTFPYIFTVDQGTYTPLTNAISLNNGEIWDDEDYTVPLGFGFQLFDENPEVLQLFGSTTYNIFGVSGVESPLIISYGADLIDRGYQSGTSLSPISFKTEGAPGSRIFKIEWANAGFFNDETNTDFVNTQLWLYEGSNDVEMHFGPTQVNTLEDFDGYTGVMIGFMRRFSFDEKEGLLDDFWYLTGPVQNPLVSYISSGEQVDTLFQLLNGAPTNGLIYRFSTGIVGVGDPGRPDHGVQVYPTLVSDAFSITVPEKSADVQYTVFDALGKSVRNGQVNGTLERVDMSTLPAGLYYVNLFSPEGTVGKTISVIKK